MSLVWICDFWSGLSAGCLGLGVFDVGWVLASGFGFAWFGCGCLLRFLGSIDLCGWCTTPLWVELPGLGFGLLRLLDLGFGYG